jgi:hypothetical protein
MLGYLHQDKAEAAISAMRDQRLVVPLIDHFASQMHHQSGTDIALVCSDSVNANPVRPMQVQGGEAGLSRVQGNKAPTETSKNRGGGG